MKINTTGNFNGIYSGLSEKQRMAVDRTEGPVLVIAGPGTGKTQILAARIAHILVSTDSLPENILCLTYTDAGAVAMRKRLMDFIGPDSYRVSIYTFHAFCNLIIQENSDYFGLHGLDAVSELEQITFVHEIIDAFPKNHPLKRYTGDIYYECRKLLGLYETMKKEHWTAEFLKDRVKKYLDELPLRDEFIYKKDTKYGKKGDLKKAAYDAEVKKMTQLAAAADTFTLYQEKLQNKSRYDFADMILWVIKAFRDSPDMLIRYQEQFHYFLVDEYQDTSGSQNELLDLLLAYWDQPNVFCVGDDDQSIFRFQGANVENIRQFVTRYSPVSITLEENYRSTQLILDAARALISVNVNRIDPNKTLTAKNAAYATLPDPPEIRACYNTLHESVAIAGEIERLRDEGVPLKEIAVIYRKHAQAADLMKYLQVGNIPLNSKRRIDILEEPYIKKLLQILRYVAAELHKPHSGEQYLYEILHYDFFRIDPVEIARISVEVYRKNFTERTTSWRESIRNGGPETKPDLFSAITPPGMLHHASVLIEGWIRKGANATMQQLVETIISESGILMQALSGDDKTWNMQLLHTFFDFIKSETAKRPGLNIRQLLETIQLMQSEGVGIPVQRIIFTENGVNFMTAHGAKGLEFGYVFMMGCTGKAWEKAGGNFNFTLPDNVFEITGDDDTEEDRRLFYVAITRAKKRLVISYPEKDNNDKDLEKSRFLAELESYAGLIPTRFIADAAKISEYEGHVLSMEAKSAPHSLFDNEFVDQLLEKYSLSVTHLNSFLRCPTTFYFNNLIRVPSPPSGNMTFGSAVHYAAEKLFKNMNAHPEKQFPGSEEMIRDFRWYMRRHEDAFTESEFKRRIEYGEDILEKYYAHYIHAWNKVTSIERSYRNVVVDDVPLNGKLDKLEFDGNFVNVVDYKTGDAKKAAKKLLPPDEAKASAAKAEGKEAGFEDEFGGDYWRQAVFYKVLMDNDHTRKWEMRSTEFDFIEPDRDSGAFTKARVNITPHDVEIVKEQIRSSYAKIKAKEFSNGCKKEDCAWCNFVNEYYGEPGTNKININLAVEEL